MDALLTREVAELEAGGTALHLHPQTNGWVFIEFATYPLGIKFMPTSSALLVKVPPTYPYAGLDMFWVEPGIRLANGRQPANTSVEDIMGRRWLRFSWHPVAWRPGVDNLTTFLRFINRRLELGG